MNKLRIARCAHHDPVTNPTYTKTLVLLLGKGYIWTCGLHSSLILEYLDRGEHFKADTKRYNCMYPTSLEPLSGFCDYEITKI